MGLLRLLNAFIQSGSDSKAAAEGYAPAIAMLVAS